MPSEQSESHWDTSDTNPVHLPACPKYVEIEGHPWAGGFCKLRAGHEGDCSLFFPGELRWK